MSAAIEELAALEDAHGTIHDRARTEHNELALDAEPDIQGRIARMRSRKTW